MARKFDLPPKNRSGSRRTCISKPTTANGDSKAEVTTVRDGRWRVTTVGVGVSVISGGIRKRMEAAVGLDPTKTSLADHSIHRVSRNLPRFDTSL
jgi:hypothetical protein